MTLLPCRACGRHVKSEECQCPFCGAARSCDEKAQRVEPEGRRLKAIAVSAALGIGAACGGGSSGSPAPEPSTTAQPLYGAVGIPVDAGATQDAAGDSPGDSATDSPASPPSPQPVYGAVGTPVDASVPKDGGGERR
jgi:hypothetical protein